MNEELEVLKTVAVRLNDSDIPYVISGSIAANYYTIPRMTRDIDIVLDLRKEQVDQFVTLFERDFYIDTRMVRDELGRRGMFNIIHNQYVVKVDFIIRKQTKWQNAMFDRKRKIVIENTPLWIISPEDLILAKLDWARDSQSELQLHDIRNMMKTAERLDRGYMQEWADAMDLEELYEKVKQ